MANKMGFDAVSVSISLESIAASIDRTGERVTAIREIGPPGINADRIFEWEQFAKTFVPKISPREIANKLADIESMPLLYSGVPIAAGVAAASAGFAFLNGAATPEMTAAALGGASGSGYGCGWPGAS